MEALQRWTSLRSNLVNWGGTPTFILLKWQVLNCWQQKNVQELVTNIYNILQAENRFTKTTPQRAENKYILFNF